MMKRLFSLALALWLAHAPPSEAQLGTGATCSVSASPMQFISYNAFLDLPSDTVSTVTVTCYGLLNVNIPYQLRLSSGQSGDINARHMTSSGSSDQLSYQIYTNLLRTNVWGNGTQGSQINGTMLVQLIATSSLHTVYGRVPAGQVVQSGTYDDSLLVTVVF
ncbi:Csu type fimbrial protein [Hyphomonas beringensis]|nr:spore coat U domain-containing protein [Hyphomonas beringensis]